jgi:hypothetical protein
MQPASLERGAESKSKNLHRVFSDGSSSAWLMPLTRPNVLCLTHHDRQDQHDRCVSKPPRQHPKGLVPR